MAYPPKKNQPKSVSTSTAPVSTTAETMSSTTDTSSATTVVINSSPVITVKPGQKKEKLYFSGENWGGNTQDKYKVLLTKFNDKRMKNICKKAEVFLTLSSAAIKAAPAVMDKEGVIELTVDDELSPDLNIALNFDDDDDDMDDD